VQIFKQLLSSSLASEPVSSEMASQQCETISTLIKGKTVLSVQCLSIPDAVGLSVGAESAFLSLVSVAIILLLICRNVWRKTLFPPKSVARQHLIQVPADLFMLSLFIADLIQALGGVMNVKWVHDQRVYQGGFCTAQGAIQQLGETIVALVTLVIAVHTFSTVWWGKGVKSCLTAAIIMGIVWLFVSLYVGLGIGLNIHKSYITPTFWCWLGPNYKAEIITGEYLWFWVTLFLSLILYTPLFLWSRGNITVDPHKWWKFSVHRSKDTHKDSGRRRHSLKLIAYPIIYSVLIIPTTIGRFIEFHQEDIGQQDHVPPAWTFFGESVYRLSGILNVLLFLLTRRGLLLFGNDPPANEVSFDEKPDGVRDSTALGRLPSLESEAAWSPNEG